MPARLPKKYKPKSFPSYLWKPTFDMLCAMHFKQGLYFCRGAKRFYYVTIEDELKALTKQQVGFTIPSLLSKKLIEETENTPFYIKYGLTFNGRQALEYHIPRQHRTVRPSWGKKKDKPKEEPQE